MFVNHPNTSNAADCVLLHSLRKPRWGEHFTPPLCKSFRKLGRLARCVAAAAGLTGWPSDPFRALRGEEEEEEGEREGEEVSEESTKSDVASSSSLGMSSAFGWEI